MSDELLLMSEQLEGQVPELESTQNDLMDKLVQVLVVVNADGESIDVVGSLIGIEVARTRALKGLKIDFKTSKEDALLMVNKYAVSNKFSIKEIVVGSSGSESFKSAVHETNVVRMIDVDINAGVATLALDLAI